MKNAGRQMNGISMHYYTLVGNNWPPRGSATQFGETEWHATLRHALEIETLISKHSAIMDQTDPQKRIGLIVDEWGTWYTAEPGTNPGFLYQQNTLRDALVAAVTLNIFHHHADRVKMANIAQLANVLQSMILTDREKMVLTPTYHVFEMFNVNEDATSLPTDLTSPDYTLGSDKIPAVSVSASRDAVGKVHLSLANTDPNNAIKVSCELRGLTAKSVSGRVLSAPAINSHNTFDAPNAVEPQIFNGATLADGKLSVELPAKSVVVLELL
jgi:alpha-N-arabinofuranosidase